MSLSINFTNWCVPHWLENIPQLVVEYTHSAAECLSLKPRAVAYQPNRHGTKLVRHMWGRQFQLLGI